MESILQAAIRMLAERPEASLEDIAKAAGVARQTIYAHFNSRDALLRAAQQRAMDETITVLDAARLEQGPADAALERLIDINWRTAIEHNIFALPPVPVTLDDQYEGHLPLLERLQDLTARGQHAEVFDQRLPTQWLAAAFIGLAHAAGDEVGSGRMSSDEALVALKRSIWRLYGIDK